MSEQKKRYIRKYVPLFDLINKIKLWPSKRGTLHGIKTLAFKGNYAEVTTHCGKTFMIVNSKNSRAARWLRNKWAKDVCTKCAVPDWKVKKYTSTFFSTHYGSHITESNTQGGTVLDG